MNEQTQNAFLKTLEEPAAHTIIIMVTCSPSMMLPTIRSRCQQVRFGALRPETVTELLLRERDLDPKTAAAIAAVSQGQMSRALDLVDTQKRDVILDFTHRLGVGEDPLALSEEFVQHIKAQQETIKAAVKAEAADLSNDAFSKEDRDEQEKAQIAFAEALIRQDLMEYLYLFEAWYRDALVFQATRDPERIVLEFTPELSIPFDGDKMAEGTAQAYAEFVKQDEANPDS